MATPPGSRATVRSLSLVLLAAFLAVGPGTAGVEVLFHLTGRAAEDHSRGSHLEPAGGGAHADHCQLGVAMADGRLPASGGTRLHSLAATVRHGFRPLATATAFQPQSLPNSRAPPALA